MSLISSTSLCEIDLHVIVLLCFLNPYQNHFRYLYGIEAITLRPKRFSACVGVEIPCDVYSRKKARLTPVTIPKMIPRIIFNAFFGLIGFTGIFAGLITVHDFAAQ